MNLHVISLHVSGDAFSRSRIICWSIFRFEQAIWIGKLPSSSSNRQQELPYIFRIFSTTLYGTDSMEQAKWRGLGSQYVPFILISSMKWFEARIKFTMCHLCSKMLVIRSLSDTEPSLKKRWLNLSSSNVVVAMLECLLPFGLQYYTTLLLT